MERLPALRPVAVFRRRKRELKRRTGEAAGGALLALTAWIAQVLYAREEWNFLALVAVVGLGFAVLLYRTFRRGRDAITLFPDRLTWRDRWGRRHEAGYDQIVDIEPEGNGYRYLVRVRGHGAFWITPEIEGCTELWRRLLPSYRGRAGLPFSRTEWRDIRTFRPGKSALSRGVSFLAVALSVSAIGLTMAPVYVVALIVGIPLMAGLHQVLSYAFERIEIEGDEIVHRSWLPGLTRRIGLGRVTGACLFDSRSMLTGVIDTDEGEIRFGYGFVGQEALVREAERLGAIRLVQAPVLPQSGDNA